MYAGFIPILAKQIPYAIGQFTVNERCTEAIYKQMSPETKANLGPVQNLSITLGSGIVAGFAAAILSHVNFFFFSIFHLFHVILIHIACGYTSITDQQGSWTWGTYGLEINHAWKGSGSKRTFRRSRSKNEYVHLLPSSLLTSYTFWDCANAYSNDGWSSFESIPCAFAKRTQGNR
jgi:hypothetical protein